MKRPPVQPGALRHYHFTELCLIGGDNPSFSYLLVNGRIAPRAALRHSNIAISSRAGCRFAGHGPNFLCGAGRQVGIHNFGPAKNAAQSLCEFVRRNNPEHLCWVGSDPMHGMVFFVRTTLAPFNSGNDTPAQTLSAASKIRLSRSASRA